MGTIVVGVDGSDGAADALRWALAEADHRHWGVTAVLAWGFLDQHHVTATTAESFDPDYAAGDAKEALDSYVEAAVGGDRAASVDRHAIADLPARALLHEAATADLLVVGARGLGGFRGLLIGSVSQKCLHQATCPVAVIRTDVSDPLPGEPPRVAVGVDGSPAAHHALTWAADEARARQAVLEVVHAWVPPYVGGFPFTGVMVDYDLYEVSARDLVGGLLDRVDLTGLTAPVEQTIICGGPASTLLDAAARAHVTVVGARGLGGVQRFLLGSVSHQVALHAIHPVVVVPMPGSD